MAILARGTVATNTEVGGSPRGWTFIHTAVCWHRWALRYLVGVFPAATKDYFDLGAAYHLFMEGKSVAEVAAAFPEQVTVAQELHTARMKGPPLGRAVAMEREHVIFGGLMTSKPDREEGPADVATAMRDYKSSANFSDNDDINWNVDPGIVGELVAAKVTKGIVDIVSKRVGNDKRVKLVEVTLTPAKATWLMMMVYDFWNSLAERLKSEACDNASTPESTAFPRNMGACVGKYGACEYYARCWGKPPESLLYKVGAKPPRNWVTGRPDQKLPLPYELTEKTIEKAAKAFGAMVGVKR